mmetsp:Transcript_22958/g.63724  ORF Transcript_22958/g.63724 Transcript_22958/m.63724 type:complete len:346 (+) Transcript_22958:1713-2750(+)
MPPVGFVTPLFWPSFSPPLMAPPRPPAPASVPILRPHLLPILLPLHQNALLLLLLLRLQLPFLMPLQLTLIVHPVTVLQEPPLLLCVLLKFSPLLLHTHPVPLLAAPSSSWFSASAQQKGRRSRGMSPCVTDQPRSVAAHPQGGIRRGLAEHHQRHAPRVQRLVQVLQAIQQEGKAPLVGLREALPQPVARHHGELHLVGQLHSMLQGVVVQAPDILLDPKQYVLGLAQRPAVQAAHSFALYSLGGRESAACQVSRRWQLLRRHLHQRQGGKQPVITGSLASALWKVVMPSAVCQDCRWIDRSRASPRYTQFLRGCGQPTAAGNRLRCFGDESERPGLGLCGPDT